MLQPAEALHSSHAAPLAPERAQRYAWDMLSALLLVTLQAASPTDAPAAAASSPAT